MDKHEFYIYLIVVIIIIYIFDNNLKSCKNKENFDSFSENYNDIISEIYNNIDKITNEEIKSDDGEKNIKTNNNLLYTLIIILGIILLLSSCFSCIISIITPSNTDNNNYHQSETMKPNQFTTPLIYTYPQVYPQVYPQPYP